MNLGFMQVLQIVFIVLKLLGAITWSWFFVLSPILFMVSITVILTALKAFFPWFFVYVKINKRR